ncbi:MAG TPA: AAA family ATPase [Herpetosiphonaceae bacterium]|nr:AAA family ATPase [Herpetosiphonaceae bacterium]
MNLFDLCPAGPALDWAAVEAASPWMAELARCPQDPVHHAEGDVATHTRMVVEALLAMPAWRALPDADRRLLWVAALLHDIGKPRTTRAEDDGRITARGHSAVGERMARQLLWESGAPFAEREQIAALIRFHQAPFFLIEREQAAAQRMALQISQSARCDLLALLAEADARGRICADQQRMLDHVALFAEFCADQGCLRAPWIFPSDHSRFWYFRREDRDPSYHVYDASRCEVTVMSGLPGAGKDTWVERHAADLPVISLDQVRAILKVAPTDQQSPVLAYAREQAREYLRRSQSFVWNATTLSRQRRAELIGLLADYDARVRIVYVEVAPDTLFAQNNQRPEPVPRAAIGRMMDRWELPDLTEAHAVEYVVRQ